MIDIKDEIIEGSPKYNITDNADGTKNIELANEIIQGGTPLNKSFFENFKSDISEYELLSCEQEDISEPTKSDINGGLSSQWSGICTGNLNGEIYPFSLNSNKTLILSYKEPDIGRINISATINGTSKTTLSSIDEILKRASYSSSYYIFIRSMLKDGGEVRFVWDLLTSKNVTNLKYRVNGSYNILYELLGSNDNTTWTSISSGSMTNNGDMSILCGETPFRYWKIRMYTKVQQNIQTQNISIWYLYLSGVDDTMLKFKNNFISSNDFSKFKCKNVLVPSDVDMTNVTSNTLNGINIDKMLQPGMRYNIMLEDNKMVNGLGVLHGVTGILSYNQSITLDFMPILLFVQYSNNTNKLVQPMQPAKTITNTGNGTTNATMSYCAFY